MQLLLPLLSLIGLLAGIYVMNTNMAEDKINKVYGLIQHFDRNPLSKEIKSRLNSNGHKFEPITFDKSLNEDILLSELEKIHYLIQKTKSLEITFALINVSTKGNATYHSESENRYEFIPFHVVAEIDIKLFEERINIQSKFKGNVDVNVTTFQLESQNTEVSSDEIKKAVIDGLKSTFEHWLAILGTSITKFVAMYYTPGKVMKHLDENDFINFGTEQIRLSVAGFGLENLQSMRFFYYMHLFAPRYFLEFHNIKIIYEKLPIDVIRFGMWGDMDTLLDGSKFIIYESSPQLSDKTKFEIHKILANYSKSAINKISENITTDGNSFPLLGSIIGFPLAFLIIGIVIWKLWYVKSIVRSEHTVPNVRYHARIPDDLISRDLNITGNVKLEVSKKNKLGAGGFGTVYRGELRDTLGTPVVVKIEKPTSKYSLLDNEIEICRRLNHDNVVAFLGFYQTENMPSKGIVLEHVKHGDLQKILQNRGLGPNSEPILSKTDFITIAEQICNGMKYIAKQKIVHSDLSCRNCLVGENLTIKVADFGLAKDLSSCDEFFLSDTSPIPVKYMPPEVLEEGKFTFKTDVWSYGIVLWEIYSWGRTPYSDFTPEVAVTEIINKNLLKPPKGTPDFIRLIMNICWMDFPNRPAFKKIKKMIRRR